MNFIIIHGVYANPNENWFPWLKKELEKLNYDVLVPKFPTPLDQSLESWLRTLAKYENTIDKDTILVGHSLGAAFILDYLEKANRKIKAAFLVAGFFQLLGSPYDSINSTFVDKKFDWEKIKGNCDDFFVVASDNDEYISEKISKQLAQNLGGRLAIIKGAGHLNKKSGYLTFPLLLETIKKNYL